MASQTRFTVATIDALIAAFEAGRDVSASCAAARISRHTFYKWLDLGKRGEAPFDLFRERVGAAIDTGKQKLLADLIAVYERRGAAPNDLASANELTVSGPMVS